jgi:hypothetical protein
MECLGTVLMSVMTGCAAITTCIARISRTVEVNVGYMKDRMRRQKEENARYMGAGNGQEIRHVRRMSQWHSARSMAHSY